MARKEFVNGLPVVMVADAKQAAKVDSLVADLERKKAIDKSEHNATKPRGFGRGLLIGLLIGAVTMLVLAPQSGKQTRVAIQRRVAKLRRQATDVGVKAHQFTDGVQTDVDELQQHTQELIGQKKK